MEQKAKSWSSFPPVWVINLARELERREFISLRLKSIGLPFELISAVDGQAL